VSYAKYQVNYCPTCQTGGKALADNTTSKFLK
jgi:formamidopyrimidine-DNA glycosylase